MNNATIARILSAVTEDARRAHRMYLDPDRRRGHIAILNEGEDMSGPDADCVYCAHINEAEYLVAELRPTESEQRLLDGNR